MPDAVRRKRARAAPLEPPPVPLELWARVDGVDSEGGSTGTIVDVAAETVTVQLDGDSGQRVVVQRRGSSVRTIPPVIPAALAGVSTAVVRVGDHGLFERGDTVMAEVGGKVVYALVQDVAPGGELVCVLWQPLENLSAAHSSPVKSSASSGSSA
mmetsp:Transcript_2643/g.7748  ORF Transcript_2643/g.7748 Transcript_2643/m.7748 type:complete len:155 (-) Transcript_2643:348-812(-)